MNAVSQPSDVRQHIVQTAQSLMRQRGFTAVGLNEILKAADVPKGSFYHYFESKEAFGEVLLESYFSTYVEHLDRVLNAATGSAADRLMRYWEHWLETQGNPDPEVKCLAVKLGAEVSDLSEAMRAVLQRGTHKIIGRLAAGIRNGLKDGSLAVESDPYQAAETLYQLWLGASLMAKITRNREPLVSALTATRQLLHLSPSQT